MNLNILTYLFYFLATLWIILYVGNVLFKNGIPFLISVFHGNKILANSINKILITGYYLINIGYAILTLKIWKEIKSAEEVLEVFCSKVGLLVLLLGIMHLFNVLSLIIGEKIKNKLSHPSTNLKNLQP